MAVGDLAFYDTLYLWYGGRVTLPPNCFGANTQITVAVHLPLDNTNACVIKVPAEEAIRTGRNCLARNKNIWRYNNFLSCDGQIPLLNFLDVGNVFYNCFQTL